MKKKNLLLAVAMGTVLAGCTDDMTEMVKSQTPAEEPAAIMFGGNTNAVTRATGGKDAAALLKNRIVFYGSKTVGTEAKPIFDNYVLTYDASKINTTETNVAGWEYVGNTSLNGAEQDTKYWDYTATQYNFVAAAGLANGEKITDATSGMKINVTDADAMSNIYIADRVTVEPTNYNKTVTFNFRRMGARMRIGFYETVPGYAIKDLVFYYVGAQSGSKTLGVGGAFPQSGKYNVTYESDGTATVKFNGGSNTMGWSSSFGELDYTSAASKAGDASKPYIDENGNASATAVNKFLATTSAQPTFAKGSYTIDGATVDNSDWKPILPNENNSLKMQLRVDYTLVALDGSGDVINVRDAYVSVPVEYVKWKPNYAYTYIFKISDKSNGYTGKGGGGDQSTTGGDGRDPEPDNGGDSDPDKDSTTGEVIPPYVPDPSYPGGATITDPDTGEKIPNPDAPLIPNPAYPGNTSGDAPSGDQHDPSNPVPTPQVNTDPSDPSSPKIDDPTNPAGLYPITFDAVVEELTENTQETITTVSTPSITTMSATSNVTTNNEYKVGEDIILTVQDGMTPIKWEYICNGTAAITEKAAVQKYGTSSSWTSLGTAAKATLKPASGAGYYVVRVNVGTDAAPNYGYKVIKVIE